MEEQREMMSQWFSRVDGRSKLPLRFSRPVLLDEELPAAEPGTGDHSTNRGPVPFFRFRRPPLCPVDVTQLLMGFGRAISAGGSKLELRLISTPRCAKQCRVLAEQLWAEGAESANAIILSDYRTWGGMDPGWDEST